ncbi:response regulator transcription factor [Streptomyces sp. NPDC054940]
MGGATAARRLTPQELKVVTLVARGRTNNAIAKQLTLSLSTVKSHLSRVQDRLATATAWRSRPGPQSTASSAEHPPGARPMARDHRGHVPSRVPRSSGSPGSGRPDRQRVGVAHRRTAQPAAGGDQQDGGRGGGVAKGEAEWTAGGSRCVSSSSTTNNWCGWRYDSSSTANRT